LVSKGRIINSHHAQHAGDHGDLAAFAVAIPS
jgi:hypothetical protein